MADEVARWRCPNCDAVRESKFCRVCGEQPLGPHDLTFRDLLTKFGQSVSSIDGKAVRTFRSLILKPGALTVAHIRGQRRTFIGPLKMFLIANAVFFAAQSATRTNILSSSLHSHLNQQDWKDFARTVVARHVRAEGISLSDYAPIFDTAVVFYAKTLIVLMALCFAPLVALAFIGKHRPFGAHLVFSLHVYAFVLLLFCVSLGITEISLLAGGPGLAAPSLDLGLSIFNLLVAGAYLYLAIGQVYGSAGVLRICKTLILVTALGAIVIGYRFLIFLITVAAT